MDEIEPELLRKLVQYDPETGLLKWLERPGNNIFNARLANCEAFAALDDDGYKCGTLRKRFLFAHRVAWAMIHNSWPKQIDHINGDRTDNRLSNLRLVTHGENSRNMAKTTRNKSGASGVYFRTDERRWVAQIGVGENRKKHLGRFDTFEEALAARKAAEKIHGYHENHGRERVVSAA